MNAKHKLISRSAADIARADGIGEPRVPGFWVREHLGGHTYQDKFVDFDDWMKANAERDDPIGDLARDYVEAVETNLHDRLNDPADLRRIVRFLVGEGSWSDSAVDAAEREWNALLSDS
mgnify:CR=1 FL=1